MRMLCVLAAIICRGRKKMSRLSSPIIIIIVVPGARRPTRRLLRGKSVFRQINGNREDRSARCAGGCTQGDFTDLQLFTEISGGEGEEESEKSENREIISQQG